MRSPGVPAPGDASVAATETDVEGGSVDETGAVDEGEDGDKGIFDADADAGADDADGTDGEAAGIESQDGYDVDTDASAGSNGDASDVNL